MKIKRSCFGLCCSSGATCCRGYATLCAASLEFFVGGAACCLHVVLGWDRAGLSPAQFSATLQRLVTEDLGVGQGELSNFLD